MREREDCASISRRRLLNLAAVGTGAVIGTLFVQSLLKEVVKVDKGTGEREAAGEEESVRKEIVEILEDRLNPTDQRFWAKIKSPGSPGVSWTLVDSAPSFWNYRLLVVKDWVTESEVTVRDRALFLAQLNTAPGGDFIKTARLKFYTGMDGFYKNSRNEFAYPGRDLESLATKILRYSPVNWRVKYRQDPERKNVLNAEGIWQEVDGGGMVSNYFFSHYGEVILSLSFRTE